LTTARIKLPPKLVPLFTPARGDLRFRVAYGGRGSGKSFTFALMAAIWGYAESLRILCTRELQISIKESMHAELTRAIHSLPWLADHYDIGESYIRGKNGTEFLFRGLRHNMSAIKSMSGIDLCVVEEASDVPQHSWLDLLPTIREPKSEIWAIYNPKNKTDPVDVMFRQESPPRCLAVSVNYHDNPWFPEELEEQRQHSQSVMDQSTYAWVWEGAYLENSNAQVLHGKVRVMAFEPGSDWNGPYCGVDFGFSQDATTAVKCWIHDDALYVEHEAYRVGLELDDTAAFVKAKVPEIERHIVRADSARPESISYLKRHGVPRMESVKKWPGSVEDGIAHMRSYRQIVIHPRCEHAIEESRLYSYKVDRLTGDILPDVVDAHNHCIDAIRYALTPLIKHNSLPKIHIGFAY
jgi:phage terminase large subunit